VLVEVGAKDGGKGMCVRLLGVPLLTGTTRLCDADGASVGEAFVGRVIAGQIWMEREGEREGERVRA
jgi:hypothetical protein